MLEETILTPNDTGADFNGEDLFDGADLGEETTDVDPFDEETPEGTTAGEQDDLFGEAQGRNAASVAEKPSGAEAAKRAEGKGLLEKVTVRYNGRDVEMTLEELKTNAQKGLNYDHIKGERDALKNSRAMGVLEDLAKNSGMPADAYAAMLLEKQQRESMQNLVRAGVPLPVIRRLGELESRELQRAEEARGAMEKQKQDKMYQDFYEAYPDLDPTTIPGEVWDMAEAGHDLLGIYRAYENRQLRAQLQMHEQNRKNGYSAVGSVQTDSQADAIDPFLSGLLG